MNGLMLRPKIVDQEGEAMQPSGWWEVQHLQRGLNAQGRPYGNEQEDEPTTSMAYRAVIEDEKAVPPQQKKKGDDDGCPMHQP